MGEPCLILRDPELIKNILVKDFNYFVNNDMLVDKKLDPLFGQNPFVLKDEEWKKTRQFLTPGFAPAKVNRIRCRKKSHLEELEALSDHGKPTVCIVLPT